ncbi:NAD(P)/FAD-dependent oxidoreductase [Paraburkholderia tropica]|uniref:NAD(P)/FAD-dependent oxidoreductase n=1 Tax=Paraburkholderia tropica TaxID=92647 RepID=UPI002AB64ABF|nr:FAD/NAD(P)-binding oxidoreductase [Paraburkholderia tropica]
MECSDFPSVAGTRVQPDFDIVIVGGGAAGISIAARLRRLVPDARITIVEPSDSHHYQPAWTLVGGGQYTLEHTQRPTASLIPRGVDWTRARVVSFQPETDSVTLDDGRTIQYGQLVVCTGLRLAWEAIDGLEQALGRHGVTSNYRGDLASYTWSLVKHLRQGKALFTQPTMPIKCAGAPQKALYLSCDFWRKQGRAENINASFHVAGPAIFGVPHFIPTLMGYIQRYRVSLHLKSSLIRVDGENRTATFEVIRADGSAVLITSQFDLLHVVPPQRPPICVAQSPLADSSGWCEVDMHTLRHPRFPNVFAAGDVVNTSNAKTAAAVRAQAKIVARNIAAIRQGCDPAERYDGYGACPLTVEQGRVILAEFGYGGRLLPTFSGDATTPRRTYWWLKKYLLPWFYWHRLLRGWDAAEPLVKLGRSRQDGG